MRKQQQTIILLHIQERLGHSSIQMTIDTYSHVAPGIQEAAAKNFDALIFNNDPTYISNQI